MTPQDDRAETLRALYQAFNSRDIETVLAALATDVQWPNGMEGGWVHRRDAVREYWTRQWAMINPSVEPVSTADDEAGRIAVRVHQVVRNLEGEVVSDRMVTHAYQFHEGLVTRMDIKE